MPRLMRARPASRGFAAFPSPPSRRHGLEFVAMTEEDRAVLAEYLGAA